MDSTTNSNYDAFHVSHAFINWSINFNDNKLHGFVNLTVSILQENHHNLILDSKDLKIESIVYVKTNCPLNFKLYDSNGCFGSKLDITLPQEFESFDIICIYYSTSSNASALQWLDADQTAGKVSPFVFSQCQAIHARSILPCQDTPRCKFTYEAMIEAPTDVEVLMSAIKVETIVNSDVAVQTNKHGFKQLIAVPSYLIALVAGRLSSMQVGPRTKVWAEPETLCAAGYEFHDTEELLHAAETICDLPYQWGIYDILVLPPSFPYGGMENPCLTFVTPTLLAGDRSLVNVVVHEIAHSWTGNLVTNKGWAHFWLNEGHTVYLERLIIGQIHGEPTRQLALMDGWKTLVETVGHFGPDHEYTKLVLNIPGVDPDDSFSSIPYEKGSILLYHLETLVGKSAMLRWLHSYLRRFKQEVLNTDEWLSYFLQYFEKNEAEKFSLLAQVDWNSWFHKAGMPPISQPIFDTQLADNVIALAESYVRNSNVDENRGVIFNNFTSLQKQLFLDTLMEAESLTCDQVRQVGLECGLLHQDSTSAERRRNAEVRFRWLKLGIRAGLHECVEDALLFVTEQGRMKFTRPLYRAVAQLSDDWRQKAIDVFTVNKKFMHCTTAQLVSKDLAVTL